MERLDPRINNNVNRSAPQERYAPAPQAAANAAEPLRHKKPSSKKGMGIIAGIVALVVLAAAAGYYFVLRPGLMVSQGYQAVFLTNGQVYFGKLQSINGTYVKMSNVYYIQGKATGSDPQATANANAVELIKLTSAVHGPKDEIVFNNNQISFFENLDDNGQAAKLMATDAAKK